MGGCTSVPESNPESAALSKKIDSEIMKERKKNREIKLLMLGTGASGKSTIAKQMRIIHQSGYTDQERNEFTPIVRANVVQGLAKAIAGIMIENDGGDLPFADNEAERNLIKEADFGTASGLSSEIIAAVTKLWEDKAIKDFVAGRGDFHSVDFFVKNINRVAGPDYKPSDEDILLSRVRTNGIVEIKFTVHGNNFRMVDVGGQRTERRKWIYCFDDVTAIIYCVAMDDYDLLLEEDASVNRMKESLMLFSEVCYFFPKTSIILFLNKRDLFQAKIKVKDLSTFFPEYTGGADYDTAANFLADKFTTQNPNPDTNLYVHTTCATDTNNVRKVFEAVEETVLRLNIQSSFE